MTPGEQLRDLARGSRDPQTETRGGGERQRRPQHGDADMAERKVTRPADLAERVVRSTASVFTGGSGVWRQVCCGDVVVWCAETCSTRELFLCEDVPQQYATSDETVVCA